MCGLEAYLLLGTPDRVSPTNASVYLAAESEPTAQAACSGKDDDFALDAPTVVLKIPLSAAFLWGA